MHMCRRTCTKGVGKALPSSQQGRCPPFLLCFLTGFLYTGQRKGGWGWNKSFHTLNKTMYFSFMPWFLLHLAEVVPFGSSLKKHRLQGLMRGFQTGVTAGSSCLSLCWRVSVHHCVFLITSQLPIFTIRNPMFRLPTLHQTRFQVASRSKGWWGQMGRREVTDSSFP